MVLPHTGYWLRFFVVLFCFLSTLHILAHCLLVYNFFVEKLTHDIIENPLYVMNHLYLAVLKIFSLSLSFGSLIMMCLTMGLYFHFGVCWASWVFICMSYIKFGIFSAIISSNILSSPLSSFGTSTVKYSSIWWYHTGPLGSVHSSIFFPLFFRLDLCSLFFSVSLYP